MSMKNRFAISLCVLFFFISSNSYGQRKLIEKIYGKWRVIGYSSLPVSALTDKELRSFMNKKVIIDSMWASVFRDTCYSPKYSINRVNANLYFNYFKMKKEELKIFSDSIYVIDVTCNKVVYFNDLSPEFDYSFIYDGNQIHFLYNGNYIHAVRVNSKDISREAK